jgi:hypothetical protein
MQEEQDPDAKLSKSQQQKILSLIELLIDCTSNTGWKLRTEEDDVSVYSKEIEGDIYLKVVTILPYTIAEVLCERFDDKFRKSILTSLFSPSSIDWFSNHSGYSYSESKPRAMISGRDFATIVHWRLLPTGSFIRLVFSDDCHGRYPLKPKVIRGDMKFRGSIMKHCPGGTQVVEIISVCLYTSRLIGVLIYLLA